MSSKYKVVFFGSFQHYSVGVLAKLQQSFDIVGVVTTPPRPAGRHLKLQPTPVAQFAASEHLPLFQLETLQDIPSPIPQPDFVVVAGFGKLIPKVWLEFPTIMPVNLHPSLLPQYPGPMPGEWAILTGEKTSGVTLIQMSPRFDDGGILAQSPIEITETDTRITFYDRAFALGANLLLDCLPKIAGGEINPTPQPKIANVIYARKLTRQDGFIPYPKFQSFLDAGAHNVEITTKWRALCGWPGVWTQNPAGKRLKLLDPYRKTVQIEGRNKT